MHLVREIYANWDPREQDSKVKILGQLVTFRNHDLNVLLGVLDVDTKQLKQLNIIPPYADIRHSLCGNNFLARWIHHKYSSLYLIFSSVKINIESYM